MRTRLKIRDFTLTSYLFLVLVVFGSLAACSPEGEKEEGTQPEARRSRVQAGSIVVGAVALPVLRGFPGRTEARIQTSLAAKVPGFVKEVRVEAGDEVGRGNLLVVMDDADVRSRIQALEAAREGAKREKQALEARLAYAKTNFERFSRLKEGNAATSDEYERADAQYRALTGEVAAGEAEVARLEAELHEARNQLRYVRLEAPVDGWVTARLVDPGTFVNPGQPVLRLDARGQGMWFVSNVDEALLERTKSGQPALVELSSLDRVESVILDHVVQKVDPASHTFEVKVAIEGGDVRGGLFGRLFLEIGTQDTLLVPASAVVRRGGLSGLYVVDRERVIFWRLIEPGRAWRRIEEAHGPQAARWTPVAQEVIEGHIPVKDTRQGTSDLWVEILSGLEVGETVVVDHVDEAQEGSRLE